MYKIIGADGQPYGPVNADQIKRWIVEGRARAETLVQADGTTEWKPLATFAEFAATPPPPFSSAPPGHGYGSAPGHVTARASNKVAASICGILLGGFGIHKFILGYTGAGLITLILSVCTCGIAYPIFHIIGFIEGIVYLTKTDDEFVRIYVDGRKEWF